MRCRQTHRRGTRNHFGPNTTSRQAKPPGQIVPLHPFSRRTFVASTAAVFAAPVEDRFAAGFVIPAERPGKPKIFMSHGRQDPSSSSAASRIFRFVSGSEIATNVHGG